MSKYIQFLRTNKNARDNSSSMAQISPTRIIWIGKKKQPLELVEGEKANRYQQAIYYQNQQLGISKRNPVCTELT